MVRKTTSFKRRTTSYQLWSLGIIIIFQCNHSLHLIKLSSKYSISNKIKRYNNKKRGYPLFIIKANPKDCVILYPLIHPLIQFLPCTLLPHPSYQKLSQFLLQKTTTHRQNHPKFYDLP